MIMKKLITLSLMLVSVFAFSKDIKITRSGGKPCKSNENEVCFKTVDVTQTERRYTQECMGRGINRCPKFGVVSTGADQLDVDAIQANVFNNILQGNNSGKGVVTGHEGVIATYHWKGRINADQMVEYEIDISTTSP